ncbi:MAG: peptidylprolyl isomerase [Oscillospiraceae bacterium]|jgi:cyclophilin family peptidyl-prolyl cis-trans isomerase|nr:peptidylprolyl isomerase [Oscillospiraceae bacterium]
MKKCLLCFVIVAAMLLSACNKGPSNAASKGNISDLSEPGPGDIYAEIKFLDYNERVVFKLFPELAPVAVEEFTTRAERGFYNGRNMHRVIEDFIIQGGSVNFDGTEGNIELGELFNVESSPHARNFYGALALVSDEFMFNYCQFYIVVNNFPVDIDTEIEIIEEFLQYAGRELTDEARTRFQANLDIMRTIPENIKQQYLTRGGLPHLDGSVSVFGQLVSGGHVLNDIAAVQVAGGNPMDDADGILSRPVEEVIIEYINIIRIPPLEDEEEEVVVTTPRRTEAPPPPNDGSINVDLNEPPPVPGEQTAFEDEDEDEDAAESEPEEAEESYEPEELEPESQPYTPENDEDGH